MGLKFQREDSLEKMFAEFAILPDDSEEQAEKQAQDIERFLNPQPKEKRTNEQEK